MIGEERREGIDEVRILRHEEIGRTFQFAILGKDVEDVDWDSEP